MPENRTTATTGAIRTPAPPSRARSGSARRASHVRVQPPPPRPNRRRGATPAAVAAVAAPSQSHPHTGVGRAPIERRPDDGRPDSAAARRSPPERIESRLSHVGQVLEVEVDVCACDASRDQEAEGSVGGRYRAVRVVVEGLTTTGSLLYTPNSSTPCTPVAPAALTNSTPPLVSPTCRRSPTGSCTREANSPRRERYG